VREEMPRAGQERKESGGEYRLGVLFL
jgi:hypothetical protein